MARSHHTTRPLFSRMISLLFAVVQIELGGKNLGWIIRRAPFLLPVDRSHETDNLLTFHQYRPSYPFHALVASKRSSRSLMDYSPQDLGLLENCVRSVQLLNISSRSNRVTV